MRIYRRNNPVSGHALETGLLYAGVGSRKVQGADADTQVSIAIRLQQQSYWLFTGEAYGSDSNFTEGSNGHYTTFVTHHGSKGFPMVYPILPMAEEIASKSHPAWNRLDTYARKLMSRNVHQVMGPWLNTPVNFVCCWTPDGCESHETRTRLTGGTGLAISVASRAGIPVVNTQNPNWSYKLSELTDIDFTDLEQYESS